MNARMLLLLSVSLLLVAAAPKKSQTREEKVRTLLQLTGGADMGAQMLERAIAQVEAQPDAPPGFGDEFRALAAKDNLVDRLVPIYVKHLSDADLDGAIAFYKTAAGRDLAKAQPLILEESLEAGTEWGKDLAQKAAAAAEAKRKK